MQPVVETSEGGGVCGGGGLSLEAGSTVILGLASIGNVGLMCADLLLSTLSQQELGLGAKPTRVGHLRTQHLQPIIGFESFDGGKTRIMTKPLEVYKLQNSTGGSIYVIIQRSLCKQNSTEVFIKDLYDFLIGSRVADLIVLTSASMEFIDINRSWGPNANYFYLRGQGAQSTPIAQHIAKWTQNLPILNGKVVLASLAASSSSSSSSAATGEESGSTNFSSVFTNITGGSYVVSSDPKTNDPVCVSEDDHGKCPVGMLLPKLLFELSELSEGGNSVQLTIIGKFVNQGNNIIDSRDLADSVMNAIFDKYSENSSVSAERPPAFSSLIDDSGGGVARANKEMQDILRKDLRMRKLRQPSSWAQML